MADHMLASIDLAGWVAAALMVATFWNRHPFWMRLCSVGANVAFLVYGTAHALPPVLMLHAVLLPINTWRLVQTVVAPEPCR